jgi:hypothetical protein
VGTAVAKGVEGDGAMVSHGEPWTGNDGAILRRLMSDVQTREIMGLWTSENMAMADDPFLQQLERSVKVSLVQITARANSTTPKQLASRWNIELNKAKKMRHCMA